jgi:hypothetical protein
MRRRISARFSAMVAPFVFGRRRNPRGSRALFCTTVRRMIQYSSSISTLDKKPHLPKFPSFMCGWEAYRRHKIAFPYLILTFIIALAMLEE